LKDCIKGGWDQGGVIVDSVLKQTGSYQAVERSGVPYFFYLAERSGLREAPPCAPLEH